MDYELRPVRGRSFDGFPIALPDTTPEGSSLQDTGNRYAVFLEQTPVGYFEAEVRGKHFVLRSLQVTPEHRRRGIATALVSDVLAYSRLCQRAVVLEWGRENASPASLAAEPAAPEPAAPEAWVPSWLSKLGLLPMANAGDSPSEGGVALRFEPPVYEAADVPYGEDFHDPVTAKGWADVVTTKRPYRAQFFGVFARELNELTRGERVLELGSGPGYLAEHLLQACPRIRNYVLLDFSQAMLDLSRERLAPFQGRASFVQGNFRQEQWSTALGGPVDAAVSMQAVHELRHKRHTVELYERVRRLLVPGGMLVVCDHDSGMDPTPHRAPIYMTPREKFWSFLFAGYRNVEVRLSGHQMTLLRGRKSDG